LRFCIRPLNGTFVFLAIMDIRAHPVSFSERPREAGRATRSRMRRRDRLSNGAARIEADQVKGVLAHIYSQARANVSSFNATTLRSMLAMAALIIAASAALGGAVLVQLIVQ
jgi:hypothetical protein